MKLEEKLARLDELATQIEDEKSLEKSLEIFEESVNLAQDCIKSLNDCKGKLVVLQEQVKEVSNVD